MFSMPRVWQMSSPATTDWVKELVSDHPDNNVSPYIANLVSTRLQRLWVWSGPRRVWPSDPFSISVEQVGRDLHLKKDHPLGIIKEKIETVGT